MLRVLRACMFSHSLGRLRSISPLNANGSDGWKAIVRTDSNSLTRKSVGSSPGAGPVGCAEAEQGDTEQRYRGGLGDPRGYRGNAEIIHVSGIITVAKGVKKGPAELGHWSTIAWTEIVPAEGKVGCQRRAVQVQREGLGEIIEDDVEMMPSITGEGANNREGRDDRRDRSPVNIDPACIPGVVCSGRGELP